MAHNPGSQQQLTVIPPKELSVTAELELDVERVVAQTVAIQKCMERVMKEGEHFGVVPGLKPGLDGKPPKKSLFQSGAEKLMLLFRIRHEFEYVKEVEDETFIAFSMRCKLLHIPTGAVWGEGLGSCNSRETKYANQSTAKVCPECGTPAIIKGKAQYGGGWLCFKAKGGCDAKFTDDDETIVNQTGAVSPTAVWNLHNTILKMACKRAKVAAVLAATAASDIFTQDIEDLESFHDEDGEAPPPPPKAERGGRAPAPAQGRQPAQQGRQAPAQGGSGRGAPEFQGQQAMSKRASAPPPDQQKTEPQWGNAPAQPAAAATSGAPAAATPAAAAAPSSSQARPTYNQVRALWGTFDDAQIGDYEADEQGILAGPERTDFIRDRRMQWLSAWVGRTVKSSQHDLFASEIDGLIAKAKAGEMPPTSSTGGSSS